MSLYALFKGTGPSGFGHASTAEQVTRGLELTGKTYLLTGCNSGIGLETLRVLALRGAEVIATARTEAKAAAALAQVGARGTAVSCELSEPSSVRDCATQVRLLDRPLAGIICNAGVMALPKAARKHGIELQLLTNHLGHFILVTGLVDALAEDGRVVVVASAAHRRAPAEGIRFDDLGAERAYSPWGMYGQSKLANILFAKQLAKRFAGSGRTANALHPGVIPTNLVRHMNVVARGVTAVMGPLFMKTMAQGAATQCWAATHPDRATETGQYLSDCNVARPSSLAEDSALAERLWERSEELAARLTRSR